MRVMLLGAPGAGKGTQAEFICKKYNVPSVSTGAMLRDAVKKGTETGLKAKAYMEAGKLVPDEIVIGIVADYLNQPSCSNGFVLDGFPRTVAQAEALDRLGIELDKVIYIKVDDEEIIKRLSGRRVCANCGATYHIEFNPPKKEGVCDNCGGELTLRKDDEEATIRNRLKVYYNETAPLEEYYREKGKLRVINGNNKLDVVAELIFKALED